MKKIKLVVSDLHLGAGRFLADGRLNLLEEFYFDDRFAEFLHYYTSDVWADHNVELILNGDIFNFLQTDYKGHYLTVITEEITLNQVERIVAGHATFFKALKKFVAKGHEVTFVVGNHDQGLLWPAVRNYINEVIGKNVRYQNIVYYFDGVHIEHGNMHEAANRMDPRKFFLKRDLPEPILNLPFGSFFFIEYVMKIKHVNPHVDKVRPFKSMMRWGLIFQTLFTFKSSATLVKYFFKSIFSRDPRRIWTFRRLLKIFFESAIFPDLSDSARRILKDERLHTVIFGHTHVYQYRQFSNDKEYFNTGTWTEVTSLDVASLGRITKLTYVLIEYPEDEKGRPRGRLKEWRGYHRIEDDVAV
ncbi:MAG: metallophosphoesterase [Bdellovibrionales bacterium]|nr:metallophosphoesterase [Bdellovibrionales bacterium]